jgi:putative addiction module killer protein
MAEVRQTDLFKKWFAALRDVNAKRRIAQRVVRLQSGLMGDVKPIGDGVSELRVDYGPGYRLYFVTRGSRGRHFGLWRHQARETYGGGALGGDCGR